MIMQISGGKRRFMGILTGLAILALPHGVLGQDKAQDKTKDKKSDSSENIKFDSVDGVELRGTFYPASKAKAPAVLMLHRYGGNRQAWEEVAALGCLWIHEEWDRRPQIRTTLNRWIYDPQGKPFGEDIAAAIWLSPAAGLYGKSAGPWLDKKEIRDKIPMLFYASKEDSAGMGAASQLYEDLKRRNKLDLTFPPVIKPGKGRGVDLVNSKDSKVADEIKKYLDKVIDKRGVNAWKI